MLRNHFWNVTDAPVPIQGLVTKLAALKSVSNLGKYEFTYYSILFSVMFNYRGSLKY